MTESHNVAKVKGSEVQLYLNTGSLVRSVVTGAKSAALQGSIGSFDAGGLESSAKG